MSWVWWVVIAVGILALVVGLVAWSGALLPVNHKVVRQADLPRPRDEVWRDLEAVEAFPSWRPQVKRVEVGSEGGQLTWREFGRGGTIALRAVTSDPPARRVVEIADPDLPYGGAWTYDLTDTSTGSTLKITEDGEITNVIYRFMSRYVLGYTDTIDSFLAALGAKYGTTVTPRTPRT
ncbi:MAG TPA: SRPBCC family protein [Jiangellaceae bacterium]